MRPTKERRPSDQRLKISKWSVSLTISNVYFHLNFSGIYCANMRQGMGLSLKKEEREKKTVVVRRRESRRQCSSRRFEKNTWRLFSSSKRIEFIFIV